MADISINDLKSHILDQKEYITLLEKTVFNCTNIAIGHGWKPSKDDINRGKNLSCKIRLSEIKFKNILQTGQ